MDENISTFGILKASLQGCLEENLQIHPVAFFCEVNF